MHYHFTWILHVTTFALVN